MSRLWGRALRGQRVIGKVPHGHWKTTTFVGALRVTGMTAPMVVDGAMNGPVFLAYVEQQLVPTLREGDTVIMDNLPAHKVAGVRAAIESVGAQLVYLPPYSWPSPSSSNYSVRPLREPLTTSNNESENS
jgi:hypothetical protein